MSVTTALLIVPLHLLHRGRSYLRVCGHTPMHGGRTVRPLFQHSRFVHVFHWVDPPESETTQTVYRKLVSQLGQPVTHTHIWVMLQCHPGVS